MPGGFKLYSRLTEIPLCFVAVVVVSNTLLSFWCFYFYFLLLWILAQCYSVNFLKACSLYGSP